METGYPGPFTEVPFEAMAGVVTDCWIKDLWESCRLFEISITDSFGQLSTARETDNFLMPTFVSHYPSKVDGNPAILKKLAECRLFLQVITLADICNAAGTHITSQAFEGRWSDQRLHSYNWPRRPPQLSADHWEVWQTALKNVF